MADVDSETRSGFCHRAQHIAAGLPAAVAGSTFSQCLCLRTLLHLAGRAILLGAAAGAAAALAGRRAGR